MLPHLLPLRDHVPSAQLIIGDIFSWPGAGNGERRGRKEVIEPRSRDTNSIALSKSWMSVGGSGFAEILAGRGHVFGYA